MHLTKEWTIPNHLNLNIKCTIEVQQKNKIHTLASTIQNHRKQYLSEKPFETQNQIHHLSHSRSYKKLSVFTPNLQMQNELCIKQFEEELKQIKDAEAEREEDEQGEYAFGLIQYENDDTYYGELMKSAEDIRQGKGLLKFANGDICFGDWKNDLLHGYGVYIFSNACRYEGEFEQGARNGFGILKSSNGDWYEGYWKQNYRHGHGKQYYYDLQETYEGQFVEDQRHGEGSTTMKSGDIHMGKYVHNQKHGPGIIKFAMGNIFTGEWINDEIYSKNCDMMYTNGDHFHGEYRKGVRVGFGKYLFENGESIEGQWFGDAYCQGKIRFQNGDVYDGEIKDGEKFGLGSYKYADGDQFRGFWGKDRKNGQGQFWSEGSQSVSGYWHNNQLLGDGPPKTHYNSNNFKTPKKTGRHAQYFS